MTAEPSLRGISWVTLPGTQELYNKVCQFNLVTHSLGCNEIELPLKGQCDKAKSDSWERRTCKDANWKIPVLQVPTKDGRFFATGSG